MLPIYLWDFAVHDSGLMAEYGSDLMQRQWQPESGGEMICFSNRQRHGRLSLQFDVRWGLWFGKSQSFQEQSINF